MTFIVCLIILYLLYRFSMWIYRIENAIFEIKYPNGTEITLVNTVTSFVYRGIIKGFTLCKDVTKAGGIKMTYYLCDNDAKATIPINDDDKKFSIISVNKPNNVKKYMKFKYNFDCGYYVFDGNLHISYLKQIDVDSNGSVTYTFYNISTEIYETNYKNRFVIGTSIENMSNEEIKELNSKLPEKC